MKKTSSIKTDSTFRYLYRRGKSQVNPYLALYAHKNRYGKNTFGITVNKKIGKAVVRNRIKRLIRESYRLNEQRIKDGYDIVAVARFKMAGAGYKSTKWAMDDLLARLSLIAGQEEAEE